MKPNIERLKKLLTHMQSGQLSVDKFDFATFKQVETCGTMGCMAGELPTLFPEKWRFQEILFSSPLLQYLHNEEWTDYIRRSLSDFFSLSSEQTYRLFYPSYDSWDENKGCVLGEDATREEVTENLRQFIEEQEKEQTTV
jgi:hypothetical protein